MKYIIRKMKREDVKDVSHVITIAWNETYRGIVSDDFLDGLYLNELERANNSYNNFNDNDNHQFVLEVDSKVVGYMNVGESDVSDCGEIHALYIINGYKGYGYGKKLIEVGIKELKSIGYNKMIIGCLDKNKSNEFYKHIGGKLIETRIFKKLNLPENVYYYDI